MEMLEVHHQFHTPSLLPSHLSTQKYRTFQKLELRTASSAQFTWEGTKTCTISHRHLTCRTKSDFFQNAAF